MNWAEWLKANYNPKKPIVLAVPRHSGRKQFEAEWEANKRLIEGEQK